jgi:nucleoside-diphosphate-sugar epimerase/predicted dehydrogenase
VQRGATIRTALIGCGRISAYHAAALEVLPDVELVAACDINVDLASELAAQHSIPFVSDDMERMLREARPDVVHIITPPSNHVTLAKVAAKYGAHMYVEKPFATTAADAQTMLAAADEAGVHICAGHSRLFEPWFREARRRIEAGEIGRVLSVRAEQGFTYESAAHSLVVPWYYRDDWGLFDALIPHPLSLVCSLLQEPGEPQVIGLNVGKLRESAVDELRIVIPASNALGELSLSLVAAPEVNSFEAVGTLGRIAVDFNAFTVLSSRDSGLPSFVNRFMRNFTTALKLTGASTATTFGVATGRIKRYMGIRALVAEFYRALREGSAPPFSPDEILVNIRLMEEIKTRARQVAKKRITTRRPRKAESPPRVLVTGASGFVGGRLVERLSQDGVSVRATTRLISRAKKLPNVEWIECDLTRDEDARRAVDGVEIVFHCAAMAGSPGSLEEYDAVNVDATLTLTRLAAEAGVRNLVYLSSMSVYGVPPRGTSLVDEKAAYDPRAAERGVYTQSKLRAEQALLEYTARHATPRVIVLRPGTIYGPGAALPVGLLRLPSTNRRPIITGGRGVPVALTYIDNVIDAMLAAGESEVATGSVYNVVDSADFDQGDVCRYVRELSGGQIRPVVVPYAVVWSMMLGVDLMGLARHRELGTARFRLKRTLAHMRASSEAARRELGWEPRVSLAEGLTRVLQPASE